MSFIIKLLVVFFATLVVSTLIGLVIHNPKRNKNAQKKEQE